MSSLMRTLLVSMTLAGFAVPISANAEETRSASCSVAIDYLFDGVVIAPYQRDFVVDPGVVFTDDFSTVTRLRVFEASTSLQGGQTVVAISYFNDVGVFDSIDLRTELALPGNRDEETVSGSHTYFTSLGVAGARTTNYVLTCRRFKP